MGIFTEVKIRKVNDMGTLKAFAEVKVAGAIILTGLRVVEGTNGIFVAMASKKDSKGTYRDIYFPATKEIRSELQEAVLDAFYQGA